LPGFGVVVAESLGAVFGEVGEGEGAAELICIVHGAAQGELVRFGPCIEDLLIAGPFGHTLEGVAAELDGIESLVRGRLVGGRICGISGGFSARGDEIFVQVGAVLATVKIRRIPPTNFAAESTHAKGRQRASRWRPSSLCAA
jgi:hypothetical protein